MDRLEDFLSEQGFARTTQINYLATLQDLSAWMDGRGLSAARLTARHFDAWLATKVWENSTQINALCAVRAYMDWRFPKKKNGQPGHKFNKRIRRIEPPPQRTLDREQVLQLLQGARKRSSRDFAFILLMVETGLRSSEVCRLKISDVDLEKRKLAVLQKGGKIRHAVFTEDAAEAIQAWIHDSRGLRVKYDGVEYPNLFLSFGGITPGRPLTRDGLRTVFRQLGEAAGIGLISPHDLRRTFVCEAIQRGVNLRLVQLQGGWSRLTMLETYSRALSPEAYRDHLPSYNGRGPQKRKEKRPG